MLFLLLSGFWAIERAARANYDSFDNFATGDVRTIGMSGAKVGLADTFLAGTSNPGGLAMVLGDGDTNLTRGNTIHDGFVQDFNQPLVTPASFGAAITPYPWALSLGRIPIGKEGRAESLPDGSLANVQEETHEYRLAASRLFLHNKLSLGMSVNLGIGEEEIAGLSNGLDEDRHASALGATWGAMYQLPGRFLLGMSYTLPMHYGIDQSNSALLPGFFQPLDTPSRLEGGIGWVPNRYFRTDIQLSLIGATPGATMLDDPSQSVGAHPTLQPKLGVAYVFMDYPGFMATMFGGASEQIARIENEPDRFHKSGGIEVKAWFFTLGAVDDSAPSFHHAEYSVGIDAGIVLQMLHLMVVSWRPAYRGAFPSPFKSNDEGLARPLVEDYKSDPAKPHFDLIDMIKKFPANVKKEEVRIEDKIEKN